MSLPSAEKYLAQVCKTADSNQLILVNNLVDISYVGCNIAFNFILNLQIPSQDSNILRTKSLAVKSVTLRLIPSHMRITTTNHFVLKCVAMLLIAQPSSTNKTDGAGSSAGVQKNKQRATTSGACI